MRSLHTTKPFSQGHYLLGNASKDKMNDVLTQSPASFLILYCVLVLVRDGILINVLSVIKSLLVLRLLLPTNLLEKHIVYDYYPMIKSINYFSKPVEFCLPQYTLKINIH